MEGRIFLRRRLHETTVDRQPGTPDGGKIPGHQARASRCEPWPATLIAGARSRIELENYTRYNDLACGPPYEGVVEEVNLCSINPLARSGW